MKKLKKFDLLLQQIGQEIQTYNDKPGYPGGNNIKHGDSGSITGNCCKEYCTDPSNIGGKTDTCQGLCDQQQNNQWQFQKEQPVTPYKYQISDNVYIYVLTSNIVNNEFQNNQQIPQGIIKSRHTYNGTNFYAIQFPMMRALFSYPQFKLGYTVKEAKQNFYNFKYQQQHTVMEDIQNNFKFNINDIVVFIDDPFVEGKVIDRCNFHGVNIYAVDFSNRRTMVFQQNKLHFPVDMNQQLFQQDACAVPAIGTVNVMGPTPGMPSIADTAGGSRAAQKSVTDPGVTTKDISQIYSPALNKAPKTKKQQKKKYPLFSRTKK